ncbi:MAG: HPr(Ser) kinase/phosphatase [Clostridia bacterium]|nr:HPr(Ser) kinase/phosphatase [Clostridia bacterium]
MEVINTEKTVSTAKAISITTSQFAKALNLNVEYVGSNKVQLYSISVARPGLQLSGYFRHFNNKCVQIIGNAEYEYIMASGDKKIEKNVEKLFKIGIPCLIVTRGLQVPEVIKKYAEKYNCPLFTSKQTPTVLSHELLMFQSDLLLPTEMVHGVLVEVFGVGVLLTGNAGVGKSETALELITRGHRLVADDCVLIKNEGEKLIGRSPENIRYFMEVRGLGIINVQTIYGPGAIRPEKAVEIVIELKSWKAGGEVERLGDVKREVEILGLKCPKFTIPVRPGRNIPVIIETAARKFRLSQTGYDATSELLAKAFPVKK